MALSGYKELTVKSGVKQRLSWEATKQYSSSSYIITCTLAIKRTDGIKSYGNAKAYIQIGTSKSSTVTKYISMGGDSGSGYKTIMTYSVTVSTDDTGVWNGSIVSYITEFPGNALDSYGASVRKITITPDIDPIVRYIVNMYIDSNKSYITQYKIETVNLTLSTSSPTKTGYTFLHWIDVDGNIYYPGTTYSEDADLILNAVWRPNQYVVSYDPNNGNDTSTNAIVTFDNIYEGMPDVSKPGYSLAGWVFEETGDLYTSNSVVNIPMDHVLVAKWDPIKYTVKLNQNGGLFNLDNITATYDTETPLPVGDYTRIGYSFIGWGLSPNGEQISSIYNLTDTFGTVEIFALWIPKKYKVRFINNLKGSLDYYETEFEYDTGEPMIADPFGVSGYSLSEWNTNADGSGTSYYPGKTFSPLYDCADENYVTELYGQWSVNTYMISFNSMGGSSPPKKTVIFESTYGTLPTPTYTGYTFVGWYTSPQFDIKIVADSIVSKSEDHTLYAKWAGNPYTVSFDADGGVVSTTEKEVVFGETYGSLPVPTKELVSGSVSGSWKIKDTETRITAASVVSIAGDHTLVADYDVQVCTVTVINAKTLEKIDDYIFKQGDPISNLELPTIDECTMKGLYFSADMSSPVGEDYLIPQQEELTIYAYYEQDGYIRIVLNGKVTKVKVFAAVSTTDGIKIRRMRPYFSHEGVIMK